MTSIAWLPYTQELKSNNQGFNETGTNEEYWYDLTYKSSNCTTKFIKPTNPLNKNPRQKGWMRTNQQVTISFIGSVSVSSQQKYFVTVKLSCHRDTTKFYVAYWGLTQPSSFTRTWDWLRQDFVTANYNEVKSLWGKRKIGHQEMCLHFLSSTNSCHAFYGMGCLAYF